MATTSVEDTPRPNRKVKRSLRLRLAASTVIFFTILLVGQGIVFRQLLGSILYHETEAVLEEQWAAIRGYLRFERRQPVWYYDRDEPEEAAIVERLRRNLFLADAAGRVLEISNSFRILGEDTPSRLREQLRQKKSGHSIHHNSLGAPYLVRSGLLQDDRHREYLLAIALPLTENEKAVRRFTLYYFAVLPPLILASSLLGWFVAGRALRPLHEVADTAQRISSQNLSLRIPVRGAGDELDHLIETFNRMMDRLRDSFEQVRQFSIDVSHELRTPLTAIRGQLEVALFTAREPEQYRHAMESALEDVERLSQLVRALLLLAQSESGQLALQKARLDFSSLVRSLAEEFEIAAEEAGVRLSTELAPECWMEADRIQLERLVSNLLSNAVKYTPPGGSVWVRLRKSAGAAELEVEDNGPGIPAADQPHIFDRFYRAKSVQPGLERGLGLGLSFVAWIAKAHGGTVRVESEPGRGSRFVVWLPAESVPSAIDTAARAAAGA